MNVVGKNTILVPSFWGMGISLDLSFFEKKFPSTRFLLRSFITDCFLLHPITSGRLIHLSYSHKTNFEWHKRVDVFALRKKKLTYIRIIVYKKKPHFILGRRGFLFLMESTTHNPV